MGLRRGGVAGAGSDAAWALAAAVVLALIWAGFLWASGRGFDATDEATYLTNIKAPLRYVAASDFAALWSPLDHLVGGDIRALRIAGLLVLQAFALAFGVASARFAGLRRNLAWAAALALAAQVVWLYGYWKATPNYNTAALCGLMLTFVGLMNAPRSNSAGIVAPLLTGLGLALAALGKPTTGLAGAAICLAWVAMVRPPRPLRHLLLAALAAVAGMALILPLLGETYPGWLEGKLAAWRHLNSLGDSDAPASRLTQGLVQPLGSAAAAKALAISPFLGVLAALSLGWTAPLLAASQRRLATWVSLACALGLGLCAAVWRANDVWQSNRSPGYLAWCFVLAAPLAIAAAAVVIRSWPPGPEDRRRLAAAALLAVGPFAYAFGTNVVIVFHAAGAAILWAAALIVLAGDRLRSGLALLLLSTAAGLAFGIAAAPGPSGPALWRQTRPTPIGPTHSVLRLDPQTSRYFGALEDAAIANGLVRDSPVVDIGGQNSGAAFVLGARPANWPTRASQPRVRPWVLASSAPPRVPVRPVDLAGAKFPDDYMLVGEAKHRGQGWSEQLWKPRDRPGGE